MLALFRTVFAAVLLHTAVADSHGGMDDHDDHDHDRFRLEAGQCYTECASGYTTSMMGPRHTCDDMSSDHMFTLAGCEPICVMPATTTGYVTTLCNTATGAMRADQCSLSCATGYRWVTDAGPSAACSQGYGTFVFSGCEAIPTCSLPTTGLDPYSTGGCSGTGLTEAQCTVQCATNYAGTAVDSCPTGGGTFTLSGCEPACNLPANTDGYTGCSSGQSASQCEVACATDYTGNPTDACASANADFVFSGCAAMPKCQEPATHTGYVPTNCGTAANPVTTDSCSVTCDTGYAETTSGTAPMDACSSDGADFVFTGCTKIPVCGVTAQTGYVISGCNTAGGNIMESQCSVQCDTSADYTGNAMATCATDGGQFALSGCDPIPKCTAPATAPAGYSYTSCSGSLKASDCTATCDTAGDYSGTAVAACAADGGTMTFSGCFPECTLPTSMPAYLVGTCTGSAPQRADQCGVTCNVGYMGNAEAACSTAGGTFTLSGCTAIPTCQLPTSATGYNWQAGCNTGRTNTYGITEAQCNLQCAPGFTGNAMAACSGGTFQLSGCMPGDGCDLPTSTTGYRTELCTVPDCGDSNEAQSNPINSAACGVECAVGYGGMNPSAMCDTAGGSFALSGCHPLCVHPTDTTGYVTGLCPTQAGAITEAQCTVSCAAGYRIVSGMSPTATCSSGFGMFAFSGCEPIPSCSLPATLPAGYAHTSGCTGSNTEAQCGGVTCATDYAGIAAVTCSADGGTFALSGCEPACTLPATTTGYDIGGCAGQTSSSQCTVQCANWYTGDATDACATAGGEHALSGCTEEPKCSDPATTGYTTSSCGDGTTTVYESQCGLACATGWTGNPMKTCSNGNAFVFSGCTEIPKCTAPASLAGYDFSGGGCSGSIYESACTASCAANYAGTPVPTCAANGGTFTFTGCEPTCSLPTTTPNGYTFGTCAAQRADAAVTACSVQCATGFIADAITATCTSPGGTLGFAGCAAIPTCSLSAQSHLGYDVSGCNPGRGSSYGITEAQCAVSCAEGYSGDAMATCSSGTFSFSGCDRAPTCTLPATTAGYETSRCVTSIDCSWVQRTVGGTVHQGISAVAAIMALLVYAVNGQL